jgi:hypothetical protein
VGQVQEVTLGLPRAMVEMALRQGMSVQDIITAHLETVDTQRRQRVRPRHHALKTTYGCEADGLYIC